MANGSVHMEGTSLPVAAGETAASAVATQAAAMVQARFTVALARPRDVDNFRARLLKDCQRPGFAEVAIYSLPRGGKRIEGPSIRFVESALRAWGNADSQAQVLFEDDEKMIVRVTVTDLETNATYSSEHRIAKTVERRELKGGQKALGERTNSFGDRVFLVQATDDDLAMKMNALVSRAIRTNGLRLIPGDIVEEALDVVRKTQHTKDATDPDAGRKKVADAFATLGVSPAHLREYLGHELGTSAPAELADLRAVFAAIRDGQATWKETMEARAKERQGDRDAVKLDEKDFAKIEKLAAERAKKLGGGIQAQDIIASLELEQCSKADLPGVLKAITTWEPPMGDEGGEAA